MIAAQKQPYFRFFASDWLGGTRGMRAAEVGVYITLIALMYERCEPLPEDHKRLARQCGCDTRAFAKMLEILVEDGKIIRADSGLWNKRVQREFDFRGKKSLSAQEAAAARWKKENKNKVASVQSQCGRNADGMLSQNPDIIEDSTSLRSVEIPFPNGNGADAPFDVRAYLFRNCLQNLARQTGKRESQLRSLLGRWLKLTGDDAKAVSESIDEALRDNIADPVSWIEAKFKARDGPDEIYHYVPPEEREKANR